MEREILRLGKLISHIFSLPDRAAPSVDGDAAASPHDFVDHAVHDLEMLAHVMQDALDAHPPDHPEAEGWRKVRDKALEAASQVRTTLDG